MHNSLISKSLLSFQLTSLVTLCCSPFSVALGSYFYDNFCRKPILSRYRPHFNCWNTIQVDLSFHLCVCMCVYMCIRVCKCVRAPIYTNIYLFGYIQLFLYLTHQPEFIIFPYQNTHSLMLALSFSNTITYCIHFT